jgi:hypothetical protein
MGIIIHTSKPPPPQKKNFQHFTRAVLLPIMEGQSHGVKHYSVQGSQSPRALNLLLRKLRVSILSPMGTNSPRVFTPGETKALAKSKVHQLSWAWVTNDVGVLGGWSSSLISKIWRTVMNSGHWSNLKFAL